MCDNPFFKCESKSGKIAVIIRHQGRDFDICEDCWTKIANSDIEWGQPLPQEKTEPSHQVHRKT